MPYPSAADAARIEARIARILTDTCDLYNTATPRAIAIHDVPCQVVALTEPTIAVAADRGESVVIWRLLLPAGTDTRPDWQARLKSTTSTVSLRGRVFTIMGDLPGTDERVRRVIAVEGQ